MTERESKPIAFSIIRVPFPSRRRQSTNSAVDCSISSTARSWTTSKTIYSSGPRSVSTMRPMRPLTLILRLISHSTIRTVAFRRVHRSNSVHSSSSCFGISIWTRGGIRRARSSGSFATRTKNVFPLRTCVAFTCLGKPCGPGGGRIVGRRQRRGAGTHDHAARLGSDPRPRHRGTNPSPLSTTFSSGSPAQ